MRAVLIDERSQIRSVLSRWREQYPLPNSERASVERKLGALNLETATAGDVAAIIGNHSWVGPTKCDGCSREFGVVARVGQEPDYRLTHCVFV